MPLQVGRTYQIRGIGTVTIRQSTREDKQKMAVRESDGRVIHWGDNNSTIAPDTERGDNFCSRTRSLNEFGFNANTFARLDWHCVGIRTQKALPSSVKRKRK